MDGKRGAAPADQKEFRWIESEAMTEKHDNQEQRKQVMSGTDSGEVNEDNEMEGLSGLFADPDPSYTFTLRYELPTAAGEEGSFPSYRSVEISLSGHKAELGQTLDSTGLTLWRASKLLSDFLVNQAATTITMSQAVKTTTTTTSTTPTTTSSTSRSNVAAVQGRRILELGAGLGLCGILAHRLGAQQVVLTDGDTDVLANLRQNVQKNCPITTTPQHGMHDVASATSPSRSIDVCQLVWGREIDSFLMRHGKFDVILGADIIYIPDIIEPLWSSVSQLLLPTGIFLLAYARRNVSIDEVLEVANKYGFVWEPPKDSEGVFVFTARSNVED